MAKAVTWSSRIEEKASNHSTDHKLQEMPLNSEQSEKEKNEDQLLNQSYRYLFRTKEKQTGSNSHSKQTLKAIEIPLPQIETKGFSAKSKTTDVTGSSLLSENLYTNMENLKNRSAPTVLGNRNFLLFNRELMPRKHRVHFIMQNRFGNKRFFSQKESAKRFGFSGRQKPSTSIVPRHQILNVQHTPRESAAKEKHFVRHPGGESKEKSDLRSENSFSLVNREVNENLNREGSSNLNQESEIFTGDEGLRLSAWNSNHQMQSEFMRFYRGSTFNLPVPSSHSVRIFISSNYTGKNL